MKNIKQIIALKTFPVLHVVLWAEKPIESCHFDSDPLETTVHSGLYGSDNLLAVISLFEAKMIRLHLKNNFKFGKYPFWNSIKKKVWAKN